jgi:hypothetical protein
MADKVTVEVRPCPCQSAYQDRVYGKGNRLHNLSQGGKKRNVKCTVCGSLK